VPTGPFYGFNRDGDEVSEGLICNWWRQGMMGGSAAHYDCIDAFSETDFTEDLQAVSLPALLMHGEDDLANNRLPNSNNIVTKAADKRQ